LLRSAIVDSSVLLGRYIWVVIRKLCVAELITTSPRPVVWQLYRVFIRRYFIESHEDVWMKPLFDYASRVIAGREGCHSSAFSTLATFQCRVIVSQYLDVSDITWISLT